MTKDEIQAVVDKYADRFVIALGLTQWNIRFVMSAQRAPSTEDSVTNADCSRSLNYETALITLYPDSFDDEDEVITALLHELLHIVIAPFDLFFDQVCELGLADPLPAALDHTRRHAIERTVLALERMYLGIARSITKKERPPGEEDGTRPHPKLSPVTSPRKRRAAAKRRDTPSAS
jgi:hypothetical protein